MKQNFMVPFFFICFCILSQTGCPQESSSLSSVWLSGLTQVTMTQTEKTKAFVFGLERVRLMAKGEMNPVMDYLLQVDFAKQTTQTDKDGDTPGLIKDAVLTFKPWEIASISVGKMKTPIGMEFNTSGKKLDFVKRGPGQMLVFERNVGLMIHAGAIGKLKFGYKAGVFNYGPANANETGNATSGQDYTLAAHSHVFLSKHIYVEGFCGSAITHVTGQKHVMVWGTGVKAMLPGKVQLKGEWIARDDSQNINADGNDFYIQGCYPLFPCLELAVKYEKLEVTNNSLDQSVISSGLNIFLNPSKHEEARIQINYISSNLEGQDVFLIMYQGAF